MRFPALLFIHKPFKSLEGKQRCKGKKQEMLSTNSTTTKNENALEQGT